MCVHFLYHRSYSQRILKWLLVSLSYLFCFLGLFDLQVKRLTLHRQVNLNSMAFQCPQKGKHKKYIKRIVELVNEKWYNLMFLSKWDSKKQTRLVAWRFQKYFVFTLWFQKYYTDFSSMIKLGHGQNKLIWGKFDGFMWILTKNLLGIY